MNKKTNYDPISDKKWREKNKEHSNYLRSRSSARSFIRNKATLSDLDELSELIRERKNNLKNFNKNT